MYQLVARGDANDLQQLGKYQSQYPEGSEGLLELELRSPIAADVIGWMTEKLKAVGVPASSVKVEGRFVRIGFKTEIAPLVLIAGAIAATIIIMGLILAWKLYKASPAQVLTWTILTPVLIIGAVVLGIWLFTKYGRRLVGG